MNPEGGQAQPKFSTGDFLNARCGAFLNGKLIYGTTGGLYEVLKIEEERDGAFTPEMKITTPLLWHGSLEDTKEVQAIVVQAAGKGKIEIDAQDDKGRVLGSMFMEVDDTSDDNYFQDVPLSRQYERKFQHRYRAAQYRIRSEGGSGLLRLIQVCSDREDVTWLVLDKQFPQNYGSSGNINVEFENLIRYLNSAELGNKTVGELLAKLFDADGNFDGPIELQKSTGGDIQYRVGEYTNTTDGWITLVAAADLRGPSGQDFGEIGAPIFFGRADFTATSGQTVFDYAHASTDEILVYVDGVLQRSGSSFDYTTNPTGGSVNAGAITFNSGVTLNSVVTAFKSPLNSNHWLHTL